MAGLPIPFHYAIVRLRSPNPESIATFGLASSHFARRYFENLG